MAVLIIIELCTLRFCLHTLSAIRGYVNGEALWSKAQRDASLQLRLYATSGKEVHYRSYLKSMQVPLGDRQERIALQQAKPDLEMARAGLLQGRNHPEDIDEMISLMQNFHEVSYLKRTIYYWEKAEQTLLKLIPISEELHRAIKSGRITPADRIAFTDRIDQINTEITPYEEGFSYTLGEGSRWLENLVFRILFGLALTVEVTGILIAVSISRNIQKGLGEIIAVAKKLARGSLTERVKVSSKDEIGVLGNAFNIMADHLQSTIDRHQVSENNLRSFFNSTRACHLLLDKELKLLYFNQTVLAFAREHCQLELKIGLEPHQWLSASRLKDFTEQCRRAMNGEIIHEEKEITYPDGESFWWSLTYEGARNANGEIIGVTYHAIDITKRVNQEQAIIAQNRSLTEIAHMQSHGMRRPVANIIGLIEMFESDDFKISNEELMLFKKSIYELDDQIRNIIGETQRN
ncbi:HAMP domain-containing protein [Mucilaginibacter sp. 21P]|uniref:HAMP domain-containing protein n=1 Tax=Mucilaginibacter sp. 21P TaxID=2778902 RepID=UPI001C56E9E7|nr:HAMP domain-containing protein [Mucilaginibacter sp. 21P]QXV66847.1 HAMP domain-containing protein [Mucilaginibacter sp. 21P]